MRAQADVYKVENRGGGVMVLRFEAVIDGQLFDGSVKAAEVNEKLRVSTGTLELRNGVNKDNQIPLPPNAYRLVLDAVLTSLVGKREQVLKHLCVGQTFLG